MLTRRFARVLLIALLPILPLLTGLGCGADDDDAAPPVVGTDEGSEAGEAGVITLGIMAPLSGAGASYGLPQQFTYQTFADAFNKEGGIEIAGKRYRVELALVDSQWDPTIIRSGTERLVNQEKVRFVSVNGEPHSPIVIPVTEKSDIVVLDWSANKELLQPPNDLVFNYFMNPNVLGVQWFNTIKRLEPQVKTLYHVAIDLQFGRNNVNWAKEAAQEVGLTNLGETFYQSATVDFAPVLASAVRANPDMIALSDVPGSIGSIVKTLRQLGYEGVIGSSSIGQSLEDGLEAGGEDLEGYYQAERFAYPYSAELEQFKANYEGVSGGEWSTVAVDFWFQAQHFFEALQQAGTIDDVDKIREALETTTITDPFVEGSPSIGMGGDQLYGHPRELEVPIVVNKIVDGQPTTVEILEIEIP